MKRSVMYCINRGTVEMKVIHDDGSHTYCRIYGIWGSAIFESGKPYFCLNGKQVFLTEDEKLIAKALSLKTQGTLLEALDMTCALD